MPTNSFTIQRINPQTNAVIADGDIATLSVQTDFILQMTCPVDPANTDNVLVPDLSTMRSGAYCKQFTNIDSVNDANGDVLDDASLSALTGGYIAVRQSTSPKGTMPVVFAEPFAPILTSVNFATGYTDSPADLTANANVIRLRFNPNTLTLPGGVLDSNKYTEFIYAKELPVLSKSPEVAGGGGGGGGGLGS